MTTAEQDRWSTSADVERAVRRRWDDGSLLRAFASGSVFPAIAVPLRGPGPRDLGERLGPARSWADELYHSSRNGAAFDLELRHVGGRLAGGTDLPGRALVSGYDQAWRLLGVATEVLTFTRVLDEVASLPAARLWALRSPLAASALALEWPTMLAACAWLDEHRSSGVPLRTITAPGVDTKFVERHRAVLAALLDVPANASGFLAALGLATRPATVRLRFDPALLGMPAPVTEAALRVDELQRLTPHPMRALIIENETTYLSVPVPDGGVVLWGKGYDVETPASLEWLRDTPIDYWGDLDTHGFAILNRVRAHLPQARSVLMDRATLLAHEPRWVREPSPTNVALTRLDGAEQALYTDLVTDRFVPSLRLEQERIDWTWVLDRL